MIWRIYRVFKDGEGETMMKKSFVVWTLVLFVVMMMATVAPSMAVSSRKIPVIFTRANPFFGQGDFWITEGDVYHVRDTTVGFDGYLVTGVGVYLEGSTLSTGVGNLNLKNNVGHIAYDSHIEFQDGGFDGTISISGTFAIVPDTYPDPTIRGMMVPWNAVQHGVWHGTGEYRGWTLVLDFETTEGVTPSPLLGYLQVPPDFTPMSTPPDPNQEVIDDVMNFIGVNHPETAQFMEDLSWFGARTPTGLAGSVVYVYFIDGWNMTLRHPVVLNPVYSATVQFTEFSKGVTYEIVWKGTWQDGVVNEVSYAFTQQKPNH
jgi:hypothetical protein